MDIETVVGIIAFFVTVNAIARGIFASGQAKLAIQKKQLEIRERELELEREKIRFIVQEDERLEREAARAPGTGEATPL